MDLNYDVLFGEKLKEIRKIRRKPRTDIARKIGISQQQLHKYELGVNRVSVGRLYDLAEALDVGIHELIPENLGKSKPIFKGHIDAMALCLWSNLTDNSKRTVTNIMRELVK